MDENLHNEREGSDRDYLEGKKDIHEADIEFQKKVRGMYRKQASLDGNFITIDCSDEFGDMLPPDGIFEKIKAVYEGCKTR